MKKIKLFSLVALFLSTSLSLRAEVLTLDSFVKTVTQGNQAYTSSQKGEEAGRLKSEEGELITSTSFFTHLQYVNDKRVTAIPTIMGDRTMISSGSMGFAKNTNFGLSGKLYYGLTQTRYHGVNPMFIPYTEYYESGPVLELKQSLWQNAFGRQTRDSMDAIEAKSMSDSYAETFKGKLLVAEAETLYWGLATVKELVKVQKENLKRAEKLRDWAKKRVSSNLADKVDLIQAEAMLKLREFELESTINQEKTYTRNFNTQRGVDSDVMDEELELMSPDKTLAIVVPQKKGVREDVKAAEAGARAATASAKLSKDKNAPTLDLSGTFSLNGKDKFDKAFKDSFSGDHPYLAAALTFSVPLDFGGVSRVNSGYDSEKISAEYAYQRKVFETDRDWNDLTKKFDETKQKLKLAYELEQVQNQKLSYEQKRLQLGRTTTYQVITFENDLASAQQLRLNTQQELLALISKMKTFQEKEEI